MAELPGVDLGALTRWLDTQLPGERTGELTGEVIAGGKSNLTYRITDGTSTWALRRPPLAHVLPTAHDMAREFRVINGLTGTAVAVPRAIALCQDVDVLGAPFYLMDFVDGIVLDKPDVLAGLTAQQAEECCRLLVDELVTLHDVDPDAVGLGDFGRPEGYLQRQVARWHKQWVASATRELDVLDRVVERLGATMPEPSAPGIVHGDYRLTNVMLAPDLTRIAAVVDWEMATLGDPLADVGLLLVYQGLSADQALVMPKMTVEQGFWTPGQLAARYGERAHRDLTQLDWYVGFGYFKLAVVAEGIHHRYLAGKTVGVGFDHFGPAVPTLLERALDTLPA